MKYIIELEETPFSKKDGDFLYRAKGFNTAVFDAEGLRRLEPYEQQSAYQKGYEAGFAEGRKRTELSEQKDDEIKVGDEVAPFGNSDRAACVLYDNPDGTQYMVLKNDGFVEWWTKAAVFKTGRHFPEVEKLLEAMKR